VYVGLNAQDAFVVAGDELSPTKVVTEPTGCRGLCSTQEQDLEGMRSFMESLRKKQ